MGILSRVLLALCLCFPLCVTAAVPPHAVVFIYHRFGDSRYPSTDTRVEQFSAQLDWLAEHHYEVWPLPRVVETLQAGKPLPDHVVVITVDDAFQSVYTHAYPLLKSHGWPFTVFVSTDAVDAKLPDFMTWDEMRELAKNGATFANHTADHGHMPFRRAGESDLDWADRTRSDVLKAQTRLQAELGANANTEPKLFAYPYGEFSQDLAELVNGLGYVAFGQQAGVLSEPLDARALPRFPINEHFGALEDFALRAAALPMPFQDVTPWDPLLKQNNPPLLNVSLIPGAVPVDALRCFLNGPPMDIHWLDSAKTRFSIRAESALPEGRDRYNCTALAEGRYYWYSHMWLQLPK
jgi:biofilm PGA synthesis lipoprotein PgaB